MDNNRLIDIILDNIDYAEYKLTNIEKKWIYKFINESHDTFIELDTDLQTITEDRYIEVDDIPTIIKIISDAYYLGAVKNADIFNSNHLCVFIKYTMFVILHSEILVLNRNVNKERLNNIIDSSMALLNMNLTNIDSSENDTKHCNCFSFGNLFKIVFYHKTT
jgi:hypothetical protein